MRVGGIRHRSVIVTDLDRARVFYRDAIGLEEVATPPAIDFPVAWFALGEEHLHLLLAREALAPAERLLALPVGDIAAVRRRLLSLGLPVSETSGPQGAERFFTADPDGNRIEVISRAGAAGRPGH